MSQPIRDIKETDKLIITPRQTQAVMHVIGEELKLKHWGLMQMLHNLPVLPEPKKEIKDVKNVEVDKETKKEPKK